MHKGSDMVKLRKYAGTVFVCKVSFSDMTLYTLLTHNISPTIAMQNKLTLNGLLTA